MTDQPLYEVTMTLTACAVCGPDRKDDQIQVTVRGQDLDEVTASALRSFVKLTRRARLE